jgi:hypothetical protein
MYGRAGRGATGERGVNCIMAARPKPPSKSAGAASRGPAAAGPSLRFHHSEELQARMLTVLAELEEADDPEDHRAALADLVAELTESGMDYYYLRALRLAGTGYVAQQSARLGMSGAVKMISSVSRRFIMNMDRDQLLSVAAHIRSLAQ